MKKLILFLTIIFLASCGTFGSSKFDKNYRTPGAKVDDNIINKLIKQKINKLGLEKLNKISSNTFNGIVLLTGTVKNQKIKQQVGKIAEDIYQVRKVHNRLKVSAPTSFLYSSGDALITTSIEAKILGNSVARKPDTEITTENGVVYLMGIVTSQEKKTLIHIVKSTSGVQNIVVLFEVID